MHTVYELVTFLSYRLNESHIQGEVWISICEVNTFLMYKMQQVERWVLKGSMCVWIKEIEPF